MAELSVWVKDSKTGDYVQRWVDKEVWNQAQEKRREEEKASKAKNQSALFFGGSSISVPVRNEESGDITNYPITECVRANPREQDGLGDMTALTFLDEPTMLHNMRFRFAKDFIYTAISRVLCAANPYRALECYKEEEMKKYRGVDRVESLPPHIFGTAERAYQALKRGSNQSMICCGESGSGKTESTKLLMRYLATAKQKTGTEVKDTKEPGVQDQVLDANPILESFGNASTLRNNNSSRFAKFTKLYFSADHDLVSADIVTFLLEKSRVVRLPPGERNYHSLYSLFYLPSDVKVDVGMSGKKPNDFAYLRGSPPDRVNDHEFTRDMMNGMKTLGFPDSLRDSTLTCLSAILHLGNVLPFTKDSKETIPDLELACKFFKVTKSAMVQVLTTREITTRGETIYKPRDAPEFVANRDTINKAVYLGLFEAMVESINKAFKGGKAKEGLWIGVLDVFGFEHFEHNSFEQLCINFCNEKLQQFFNAYIISSEQEEYEREGIFWTTLDTRDRSGCLRLFDAKTPPGIFALLDSGNSQNSTHKQFLGVLMAQHKYNRFMYKPKPQATRFQSEEEKRKQDLLEVSFGVKHYAAAVIYDSSDLLVKNADKVDPALIALFNSSSDSLIKTLLARQDLTGRKESVGTFFVNQLTDLTATLSKTQPHFIRCINPNGQKRKQYFDTLYVSPQLVNGGLVEAVRMLKLGYPTRYPYSLFFNTFKPLLKVVGTTDSKESWGTIVQERFHPDKVVLVKSKNSVPRYINIRDFCEAAMKAFGLQRDQYQCGLTKMFFKSGLQELVEETLQKGQKPDEIPPKSIHKIERWLMQKRIMKLTGCTKALGRWWLFQKRTRAAREIQVAVRTVLSWDGRVHWKERRITGAKMLANFWRWCKHDRQLLHLRKIVGKIIDQLREVKAADADRRKQEKNRTPAHVLADFAEWIQGLTGEPVISSLFPSLKSGEILCNLLTKIKTDLVIDGVHQNKKQMFFYRDNVAKALKALLYMRCPSNLLFTPDDLLSQTPNNKKVIYCLTWLARHAYTKYEIKLPKYLQAKLDAGGDLDDDEEGTGETGDKSASEGTTSGGRAFGDVSDDEDEEDEKETDGGDKAKPTASEVLSGGTSGASTDSAGSSSDPSSATGSSMASPSQPLKSIMKTSASRKGSPKGSATSSPTTTYVDLDGKKVAFKTRKKKGKGSAPSSRRGTMRYSTISGKISLPVATKDALTELKENFDVYPEILLKGYRFRQYTLEKVVLRWMKLAPAREMAGKELTWENVLAYPNMRLIITKAEDQAAVTAQIKLSDVMFVFAGKRDGGKCFAPDSKASDATVALDERCLVIGTSNRTLGFEAESSSRRDAWVEALEWAVNLYREATKTQAESGSEAKSEGLAEELDPLLVTGALFTKHGLNGVTRRWIRCTPTHIYWLKSDQSPLSECVDPIAWDSISEIVRGKQTLMFNRSRAKEVEDSLCISIVYRADHRSLDLVADTEEQAFEFYGAMSGYLQELIDKYKKSSSKIAMEKELEQVRQRLEKEREAHAKTISDLAGQKDQTEAELEQLRATRASLAAQHSSRESEMETLKNMMQEEKSQLIKRIEDLTQSVTILSSQLDTELSAKSKLLSELQEARQAKLELIALRAEVAEQRRSRLTLSTELSSMLSSWNQKFGVLHGSISKSSGEQSEEGPLIA